MGESRKGMDEPRCDTVDITSEDDPLTRHG